MRLLSGLYRTKPFKILFSSNTSIFTKNQFALHLETSRFNGSNFSLSNMSNVLKSNLPYNKPQVENLTQFIARGLRKHSGETLIIDATTGRRWDGKQIEAAVINIAKFLIYEYNLNKGDVCSIYAKEDDLIAILALALMSIGATYHFLSDRSSGWDVHDTATAIHSKYLFSTHDLLMKLKSNQSLGELEQKLQIVSLDKPCEEFKKDCKTIMPYLNTNQAAKENEYTFEHLFNRVDIEPDRDYAVIQFSSGTTGKPKPIPRTHKNLISTVAAVEHEELIDLKPGVVFSGIIPMTHRPGIWALLATVNKGNTFVIWNELGGVQDALQTIEKYKVTLFSSSLPFLSQLGNTGISMKNKYDISSLKHVITAGAKIVNPELPKSIVEHFKLDHLRQCFGMTESGWCFLIEKGIAKDNYLSVGHVVPGMEAVIIDRKTKKKLGVNERGEIGLRGDQIFPGYLTNETGILNRTDFSEDGWFMIGDEGYYDKNGLIFIEGRYKEKMMFSNDYKFFPTEIEAVINQHPAVEASCVVKIPNENKDYEYDTARAYVTTKRSNSIKETDIIDFLNERIPEAFLEGGVHILKQFPRLNNGKVDKQKLSKMSSTDM